MTKEEADQMDFDYLEEIGALGSAPSDPGAKRRTDDRSGCQDECNHQVEIARLTGQSNLFLGISIGLGMATSIFLTAQVIQVLLTPLG